MVWVFYVRIFCRFIVDHWRLKIALFVLQFTTPFTCCKALSMWNSNLKFISRFPFCRVDTFCVYSHTFACWCLKAHTIKCMHDCQDLKCLNEIAMLGARNVYLTTSQVMTSSFACCLASRGTGSLVTPCLYSSTRHIYHSGSWLYAVNWCVSRLNGRDTMDVIFFFSYHVRAV